MSSQNSNSESQKNDANYKVDFPFDLNNLFQCSFDTLKLSIEYLARQQKDQANQIQELLTREAVPINVDVLDLPKTSFSKKTSLASENFSSKVASMGVKSEAKLEQSSKKSSKRSTVKSVKQSSKAEEKPPSYHSDEVPDLEIDTTDLNVTPAPVVDVEAPPALAALILASQKAGGDKLEQVLARVENLEQHAAGIDSWQQKASESLQSNFIQIKKIEGAGIQQNSKLTKTNNRITATDEAIKLLERMNNATADGGKGIMQSFVELEERMQTFCDEKFTTIADINPRIQAAEKFVKNATEKIKELAQISDVVQKRTAKHEKNFENHKWRLDKLQEKLINFSFSPAPDATANPSDEKKEESLESLVSATGDGAQAKLLNRILTNLRMLEFKIDEKIDREKAEEDFEELRNLVESGSGNKGDDTWGITGSKGEGMSDAERKELQDCIKKTHDLEQLCGSMQSDLRAIEEAKVISSLQHVLQHMNALPSKQQIEKINLELLKVKEGLKDLKEDVQCDKENSDKLKVKQDEWNQHTDSEIGGFKGTQKWVEDSITALKKMMQRMNENNKSGVARHGSIESGDTAATQDTFAIKQLQADMHNHITQTDRTFMQVHHELGNVASLQDLANQEVRSLDKIKDLVTQFDNRYADKDNIRKKIMQLEKNLKNMYDLQMASQSMRHDQEEDGLLTRKQFGPATCVACEKDIVNLQGQKVDYLAWKRMPFRDTPNDRIAKYGQGFSKMLNSLKNQESNLTVGDPSVANNTIQAISTGMLNNPSSFRHHISPYHSPMAKNCQLKSPKFKQPRPVSVEQTSEPVMSGTTKCDMDTIKTATAGITNSVTSRNDLAVPKFHPVQPLPLGTGHTSNRQLMNSVDTHNSQDLNGNDMSYLSSSEMLPNVRGATRQTDNGINYHQ